MIRLSALALAGAFACLTSLPAISADPPKAADTAKASTTTAPAPKAAETAKAANPQQERMKDCNKKAEGMSGDKRKEFMSACLSGKDAPAVKMTQQEKMKSCNTKAGEMKGDERKKFMSSCLSG